MKRISSHLGSLTLLMASAAMLTACSGKQDQSQMMQQGQAPAIAVVTLSPEETDLQTTFPATIKGKTDIDIRPQVTGFITKVHVDEGQHVRKGQVLFTLDQVQFNAAVIPSGTRRRQLGPDRSEHGQDDRRLEEDPAREEHHL